MFSFHFKNYKSYSHIYDPSMIGLEPIKSDYFKKAYQYSFMLNKNLDARQESLSLAEELREECNKVLAENNIPNRLTAIVPEGKSPWLNVYGREGFVKEHIHEHESECWAAVMSLSRIDEPVFFIDIDGERKFYSDTPGLVRLFRGDVYNHGTLPTPTSRRILVIDYLFEYIND